MRYARLLPVPVPGLGEQVLAASERVATASASAACSGRGSKPGRTPASGPECPKMLCMSRSA